MDSQNNAAATSVQSVVPLPVLPDKPRCGEPCNGCGACCASELCHVGKLIFPEAEAPCPALAMSKCGSRVVCSLVEVEIESGMEPVLQHTLGIGLGCSMDDHDDCVMPEHLWSEPANGFRECLFCRSKCVA